VLEKCRNASKKSPERPPRRPGPAPATHEHFAANGATTAMPPKNQGAKPGHLARAQVCRTTFEQNRMPGDEIKVPLLFKKY